MAPALDRIKVYSAKYKLDREAQKAESAEKSRVDILRDTIEKREAGADDEPVVARLQPAGESEQQRGNDML